MYYLKNMSKSVFRKNIRKWCVIYHQTKSINKICRIKSKTFRVKYSISINHNNMRNVLWLFPPQLVKQIHYKWHLSEAKKPRNVRLCKLYHLTVTVHSLFMKSKINQPSKLHASINVIHYLIKFYYKKKWVPIGHSCHPLFHLCHKIKTVWMYGQIYMPPSYWWGIKNIFIILVQSNCQKRPGKRQQEYGCLIKVVSYSGQVIWEART